MQDAVLKVGDMAWRKDRGQFALVVNRFNWEEPEVLQRRQSALHFDRVLAVKSAGIRRDDPEAVLCLLAIAFEESDPPSGEVTITFAGGGVIRLAVECLEAQLKDLGPTWATARQPSHPIND
jgi:hypothetical protein